MVDAPDILNWITQPSEPSESETGFSDLGVIEVRCFIQRGDTGVFSPIGGFLPNSQLDQIKEDLWTWYDDLGWSLTKHDNAGNINDWWKVTIHEGVSNNIFFELYGDHPHFGGTSKGVVATLTIRQASDNSSGIIEGLKMSYKPPSRTGGPPPSTTYPPKKPKKSPVLGEPILRKKFRELTEK